MVTLDIDHFKAINDTYGHSEGDAARVVIAAELLAQARTYDLVGRIGGYEALTRFMHTEPVLEPDVWFAQGAPVWPRAGTGGSDDPGGAGRAGSPARHLPALERLPPQPARTSRAASRA